MPELPSFAKATDGRAKKLWSINHKIWCVRIVKAILQSSRTILIFMKK